MIRLFPAMLGLLAVARDTDAPTQTVEAKLIPATPFIERRGSIQIVNADILVRNTGATTLKLVAIREQVFDRHGKLELEREVNANGHPPALSALGDLAIAAGATVDWYQPFERYDPEVELARVRLELIFVTADRPVPPVAFSGDAVAIVEMHPRSFHSAAYCLPLRGRLLVHDGHDLASHHRRRNLAVAFDSDPASAVNANLFAYDFVRIDGQGNLYRGDVDKKENWYTFGAPVLAPTSGVITEVLDGVPDNRLSNGHAVVPPEAERLDPGGFGNHVALRGSDGRVSWLLHMEAGTVTVHAGQHVSAGALLGRIGFSGDALFPHLHYTVTAGPDYPSQGVPSVFRNFTRLLAGRRFRVGDGQIDTGDLVERGSDCSIQSRRRHR